MLGAQLLAACGSDAEEDPPVETCDPDTQCTLGATTCSDATHLATCVMNAEGCLVFENSSTCEAGAICSNAMCVDDPTLAARLGDIERFIDGAANYSGTIFDFPVDKAALLAECRAILAADPSPIGYARAVRHANIAYKDGHISAFLNDICASPSHPLYFTSYQDACTQPSGDGMVINKVGVVNPMGFEVGDVIISWNERTGDDLETAVIEAPMCASTSASASARRYLAGTSLLGVARPGDTIGIRHLDGSEETKQVGPLVDQAINCRNPLGTPRNYVVRSSWLDEKAGIALIDVPSLHPGTAGTGEEQLEALRQLFITELADVPNAVVRIWDLRGNTGGFQEMGLFITSGLPNVEPQPMGDCEWRMASSDPFTSQRHVDFDVVADAAYAYAGANIILIDGLTHSAGDWFAYGMKEAVGSDAILIGSPTSGAFGAGLVRGTVTETSQLYMVVSPLRCVDQAGELLEGRSVEPDIAVELDPQDLADGKDTVLERAVEEARGIIVSAQ